VRAPSGLGLLAGAGGVLALYTAALVASFVPRHDAVLLPIVLWVVFRALDRVPIRWRFGALSSCVLLILAAALVQLWLVGYEGRSAVLGGIIPWSDSHDYSSDALRLVHGEPFGAYASKRPLFPALLAILFRASGDHLRFALVTMMVAGALSVASVGCEVWRTHGWRSAWLLTLILLIFERRWTGFVQTEHLAFPLGALGFVALWRVIFAAPGSEARRPWLVASSLLALTLALLARPGPFFLLPALVGWAACRARAGERRRVVAAGVCAVALGFGANRLAATRLGAGAAFSDYPAVLYGMVSGGDYNSLCKDHPEVCALSVDEFVPAAYAIIARDVRAQPSRLPVALGSSMIAYVASPYGLFSLVFYDPDDHVLEDSALVRRLVAEQGYLGPVCHWYRTLGSYSILNAVVMGASAAVFVLSVPWAAWRARRNKTDASASLLVWANIGILLSAPFLPPWNTPTLQTVCSAMPFVVALPAVVLLGRPAAAPKMIGMWLVGLAPALLAAGTLLVAIVRVAPAKPPSGETCQAPMTSVMHILRDTEIELHGGERFSFRRKNPTDLEANLLFLRKHNDELVRAVEAEKKNGTIIAYAYDACTKHARVLIDREGVLDRSPGAWLVIQGEPMTHPQITRAREARPAVP